MKAPDKIYIHEASAPDLALPRKDYHLEYIRKDLLLAWAKQKQYESTTIVADNFWQEVIDKINEL